MALPEPLSRQVLSPALRWAPPKQCPDHSKIAEGIDPERCRNPDSGYQYAAQCRTNGPTDIDADTVCRDRRIQIPLGNELRNDRLPGRGRQRTGYADEKREQQQIDRCYEVKPDDDREYRGHNQIDDSPTMRNFRLSRMSASAPAGTANKNIGNVFATCTSDTMSGSGLRLVISQPDAALYIQPPMFETTVAVQITAKIA